MSDPQRTADQDSERLRRHGLVPLDDPSMSTRDLVRVRNWHRTAVFGAAILFAIGALIPEAPTWALWLGRVVQALGVYLGLSQLWMLNGAEAVLQERRGQRSE